MINEERLAVIGNLARALKEKGVIEGSQILELLKAYNEVGFCIENRGFGVHVRAPLDNQCLHCGKKLEVVGKLWGAVPNV